MYGICGRPLTMAGTMRPAAFSASSTLIIPVPLLATASTFWCCTGEDARSSTRSTSFVRARTPVPPHLGRSRFGNQSHGLCPRNQLQRTLYNRRVNHLGTQADHANALLLGLVVGRNNLQRLLNFDLRRRKGLVNHGNLQRVDAAHAFEPERTRIQAPDAQTVHVGDIAED